MTAIVTIRLVCDTCHHIHETGAHWIEAARRDATHEGWTSDRRGDVCPDCTKDNR